MKKKNVKNFSYDQCRRIWERADWRCEKCGAYQGWNAPVPHHRKPKSRMRPEDVTRQQNEKCPKNGAALCLSCHRLVHMQPKQNAQWLLHREDEIE